MVAILEKSEHNVDFHPIVDFVEASPLRYALTFKPNVYVSHIRQFWSTARIETTKEGTKILATVDGILRTVTESSLRRNLKLKDKEGISSLPDAKLFESLTLMGYNISPNQKFTFQKGQFSHQWKYLIHTIMQCLSPKSTGFNEFSSNIATALVCLATNMVYNYLKMIFDGMVKNVNNKVSKFLMYPRRARIAQSSALPPVADKHASPLRDVNQGEACPTDSGFKADQDRANIAKTLTLPHESTSRVTSLATDGGSMQHKLDELTALCTSLQRQQSEMVSRRRLDVRKEAAERVSDDTANMATVLTSMDAATVLASRVAEVPTGSGSILTAGPPPAEVPTGNDVVPTASPIFATATVVQEQIDAQVVRELEGQMAREDKRMSEQIAKDAEIARIHAEEELHIMIDGLDRSNETVAKYLQEYHQFAIELPLERRIKLISDLVRYQDNYAKVHKYQSQQRKLWSKKQKRDYYMAVIKSKLGWKVKDFRGMTFEEIKAKFTIVWKQIKSFIPMGSKEEAERFKRKGIRFEQESVKKLKTLEEVKASEEVPEEKLSQLPIPRGLIEAFRQGRFIPVMGLSEGVSQHQNLMHAPVEWKLYDTCGVHLVTSKDKEIFMLVEKDYPLRKGLVIVMICYKLQVENYSQMASDLILKIHKIANRLRQEDD
nr:synaptobrevin, longin-like domain protein [Tanacetum cinerariifolium]